MYKVALATVRDDITGIDLRLIDNKGDIQFAFMPKEQCGRIPPDANPKKELEKFAEALRGHTVNLQRQ